MRIAFFVETFPKVSEVFIINQVADLLDRGVDVEIYYLKREDSKAIAGRYEEYRMWERAYAIGPSVSYAARLGLLVRRPLLFLRALRAGPHGVTAATTLRNKRFDVAHCHFGRMANRYLPIRRLLNHTMPMLTSLYGYDVSLLPKAKGSSYYDDLKRVCHRYIVMSEDMKQRVMALGFSEKELTVLPVSIDVDALPFAERTIDSGESVQLVSVGRFVEKKGFDDLIRAVALVKKEAPLPFHVTIIGGGEGESELKKLAEECDVSDVLSFAGYMKLENVYKTYLKSHLYLQPSKTARNGDME